MRMGKAEHLQCDQKRTCQVTLRDFSAAWYCHACLSCAYSLVCITGTSGEEVTGAVAVEVPGRGHGVSEFNFAYQVREC